MSQQRHLFSILNQSLQSAPKSVEEIGEFIEERAKWDDWTRVPADIVNRRYDPKSAEELLGGWNALWSALQRLPQEKLLQQTFTDANNVYVEYPKLYFEYWLGIVPYHSQATLSTGLKKWGYYNQTL